jgi:hypothetical protein
MPERAVEPRLESEAGHIKFIAMARIIFPSARLRSRLSACAIVLVLLPACQNVPKYKRSSGKFAEWSSYEGRSFSPSNGTVTAVDTTAQTITITQDENSRVFPVTSETRIMHEGDDITLAQLPLNQEIKFTLSYDRKRLLTVWYGTHSNAAPRAGAARKK